MQATQAVKKFFGPIVHDALLGIEAIDQKSAPSSDQRTEIKNKEKLSFVQFFPFSFTRKFPKKDKKLHETRLKSSPYF